MGRSQKQDPDITESLRILSTQIETINQQLASGASGGSGTNSSQDNQTLQRVENKLNYLYEMVQNIQNSVRDGVKEHVGEMSGTFHEGLNGQLQELSQASSHAENTSREVSEIKRSLANLIKVYKEEVRIFSEQNRFLQQQLAEINKKLDQ